MDTCEPASTSLEFLENKFRKYNNPPGGERQE